jgi:hypothetical protein
MSLTNIGLTKSRGIKRTGIGQERGRGKYLNVLVRISKGKSENGRKNGRWNNKVKIGGKKSDGRT